MRCKNAKMLISASMDGELSQREERRLREHVCRCAECATEQAQVSNLRDVMAVWADEDPSEWLAQNFACRLEDEMARKPARRVRSRRRIFGTAVAGFATALLAFAIIIHSQFMPQQTVQPGKPAVVEPHGTKPTTGSDSTIAVSPNTAPTQNYVAPIPRPSPPGHKDTVRATNHGVVATIPTPHGPPTVATSTPNPGPTPLTGRVAANPTRSTRPVLTNRGSTGRDAEVKRMVLHNIMLASNTEGNAQSSVTDHIAHADLAMNGSVEEVRGVIRKAVDVLARSQNRVDPTGSF